MLSNGKLRKSNSGFTLVELIVTIVLMVIVGGAITSFVVVAQRNYNYGVADTDLQYEAQLLSNRMQDLVIDTAKGISYEYSGKLASGEASEGLILDDSLIDSDVDVVETKNLYVYDSDKYYRLEWRTDTHEIWYSEYKPDNTKTLTAGPELLAEYVTAFSVDLRELASKRTVKYTITFTKEGSGKEYTTTHKIKLRNEALVNTAIDAIYTPGPVEITPTGITVYVEKDKMWPTETAQVAATVTSDSGLMPSQTVTWSVEGNTDSNTAITANLLTYGVNEAGSTVESGSNYVTVKAVQGSLQATAVVGVRRINGLSSNVYTTKSGTIEAIPGNKLMEGDKQVTVELPVSAFSGAHISDLLTSNGKNNISNMGGITIAVTQGAEYVNVTTKDEENGKLVFDVKDNIDYTANPEPKVVEVTISCKRAGFTDVKTVQRFTVAEQKISPIIGISEWNRYGKISFDMWQIPEEMLKLTKSKGKVYGHIDVVLSFYHLDGGEKKVFKECAIDNRGAKRKDGDKKEGNNRYSYLDDQELCKVYYEDGNYYNFEIQLLPQKFAFADEFSQRYDKDNTVDGVFIKIKAGDYESEMIDKKINPVNFKYRINPSDSNTLWMDDYEVSVALRDDMEIKVYYKLDSGWDAGEAFKINKTYYSVNNVKDFVFSINDKDVTKKIDDIKVDKDDKGSYIKFEVDEDFANSYKDNTMIVSYEGQKDNPDKGCDGVIKVHFVKANIQTDNSDKFTKLPKSMYAPEDFTWVGEEGYYYITNSQRIKYCFSQGKKYITYQEKKDGSWKNRWYSATKAQTIVYWLEYKEGMWQYNENQGLGMKTDR